SKFFLHWYWRMIAQLGLSDVWLASGNLPKARLAADRFLQSALATAEPNLHALAWDVDARVAMAEKNAKAAEEKIENGLAVLQASDTPTTGWRSPAPGPALSRQAKNGAGGEAPRARPEGITAPLATSFPPDAPVPPASPPAARVRGIRTPASGSDPTRSRTAR